MVPPNERPSMSSLINQCDQHKLMGVITLLLIRATFIRITNSSMYFD